ncbi:endothelial cell-specific chemotaxis regulator [Alexandromys fortis]|uniref:endothelial cell-specific chemotaxis regulator n=1 Tax=Alexandromys fortis TaxID=100897 RepID=UPI0021538038|nr:endothelial cell-specific chemotaxis regulator [Microtus fortis]
MPSLCIFASLTGYSSQSTTTQTSPGDQPSSGPGSSRLLLSTTSPEILQKASQVSFVSSQPVTPRPSTTDSHTLSLPGLTSLQPQKHTLGLGAGTGTPDSGGGGSSSSTVNSTRGEMSLNATASSVTTSLQTMEDVNIQPSPTPQPMITVMAFGVISFIVILVVVGITLASVVSLRFMCRKNKESEDPQKPGSSGLSESRSTANGEKDSITLISMKNINMNNSKGCSATEKIL